jgi:hypothetical protein
MTWVARTILFFAITTTAHAESFLDFSLKSGLTVGTLTKADFATGELTDYSFGGVIFILGYNFDVAPKFTLMADIHLVTDPTSLQLTRSGFDISALYHIWGGSRRLSQDFHYFEAVERQDYNVSLAMRTGLHKYSASSFVDQVSLSGSVYDAMVGVQYRQDFGERESLVLEFYTTLLSFKASLDSVVSSQMLFLVNYRFFL